MSCETNLLLNAPSAAESQLVGRTAGLQMIIGTMAERKPEGGYIHGIENELRLIKAAVLYADGVKLCSFKTSILDYLISLPDRPFRERVHALAMMLNLARRRYPHLLEKQPEFSSWISLLNDYLHTFEIKHPTRKQILRRIRLEGTLKHTLDAKAWAHFANFLDNTYLEGGEIKRLADLGLVTYHKLNIGLKEPEMEAGFAEFVSFVQQAITESSSYPLFDALTHELVVTGLTEGTIKFSEGSIRKTKHTALAALLLERLPLFETTIDEVLDIRRELQRPLVRFRSAVVAYSEQIKSAPWDKDFIIDAEHIFYKEVEPAVLEIEEETKSNRYLTALVRKIADKPLTLPIGSSLAIAMSQLSSLPVVIAQAVGVGLSAAPLVYDATKEWKEKNLKTEQNHLFFYYRAKKELTR